MSDLLFVTLGAIALALVAYFLPGLMAALFGLVAVFALGTAVTWWLLDYARGAK